jgi:hypothetical protein
MVGTLLAAATLMATTANASVIVNAGVGAAATGVNYYNFNAAPPSGAVSSVLFTGTGQFATGSAGGAYAAPYVSNGNGAPFGDPDGVSLSQYASTGIGTVTVNFSSPQQYVGLLWGSVDGYNTLSLWDGTTLVGTVVGNDVQANANGNQGVNGTYYVNITSTLAFDHIVAESTQYAFEFDNLAYNARIPNTVPEPATLGLMGIGLLGAAFARRRKSR